MRKEGILVNDENHMTISIPTDDEGYILLKCEYCGTFFKGIPSDIQNEGVLRIFCPSCGLAGDSFVTEDVLELAIKMTTNLVNDMLYNVFKDLERHNKKSSMVKFKVGKRPPRESEEPIRSGVEALEICTFPCCDKTAKIKPLLKMTGAYCPFCGVKNYEIE